MGTVQNRRRLGWVLLASISLPLAGMALQAGDMSIGVPAAEVFYAVPGVWEKQVPHESQSVCSPTLQRPEDSARIDVEVFPNDAKKTYDLAALKAIADSYAGTMQEIKGALDCEVTPFESDHHVQGYRIHYVSEPTHFTDASKTYQNSIYVFANRSGHLVFLTYSAEAAHYHADIDASIHKTIALVEP